MQLMKLKLDQILYMRNLRPKKLTVNTMRLKSLPINCINPPHSI